MMKLKKRIMLVVSMAIMTLSVFLSDIQVHAASYEVGVGKTYSEHIESSPIFCDGNAVYVNESGESFTDSVTGKTDYYIDNYYYGYGSVNFSLTTQYSLPLVDMNNGNAIYFDSTYDSVHLYCYLRITPSLLTNATGTDTGFGNHTIETISVCAFGQEYPVYWVEDSGSLYVQINTVFKKTGVEGGIEKPSNFYLKINSRVSGAYVSDAPFTLSCYPTFDFQYGLYRRLYMLQDVNSSEAAFLNYLNEIRGLTQEQLALMRTYYPHLTEMLLRLTHIDLDFDELLGLTEEIIDELENANIKLDTNNAELYKLNSRMVEIHNELISLHDTLKNQTSADKNITDSFKQDSDSQSNQLNNLNQQTQPDKIDVDNASGVVDQNLNINTDANYGVLLSTFTSNGKILTMLLAVSSIGLISYVLFGKR